MPICSMDPMGVERRRPLWLLPVFFSVSSQRPVTRVDGVPRVKKWNAAFIRIFMC